MAVVVVDDYDGGKETIFEKNYGEIISMSHGKHIDYHQCIKLARNEYKTRHD